MTRLVSTSSGWADSLLNHPTSSYAVLGTDAVDGVVFIKDETGGLLRQAVQSGGTWKTLSISNSKGWPANVTYDGAKRMLRFNGMLYLLAKDNSNGLMSLFRTAPASGNTAFSWSGPLMTFASGANALYCSMAADASYLYLGEYGDVPAGPSAYRTSDGTTFTTIYTEVGLTPHQRHIHAIAPDPFNVGDVWMTTGDANAAREIMRSRDYGATWSVVQGHSDWQAVYISFTPDWVYLAGDSQKSHLILIDRATGDAFHACAGLAKNIAVPGATASTDRFYANGWMGTVDPDTGAYYFITNDASVSGNTPGLFIVTEPGAAPILIDKLNSIPGSVEVFDGWLWFGRYRRPLLGFV
jgi:hypothetical protein